MCVYNASGNPQHHSNKKAVLRTVSSHSQYCPEKILHKAAKKNSQIGAIHKKWKAGEIGAEKMCVIDELAAVPLKAKKNDRAQ